MHIVLSIVTSENSLPVDWTVIIFESEACVMPVIDILTHIGIPQLLEVIVKLHKEFAIIGVEVACLGP